MGRQAEDFLLRTYPNSPFWYYRLKGWKNFKSTGQRTKAAAKKTALDAWMSQQDAQVQKACVTFGNFAKDFYCWDSPWCTRQHAKGRLQKSTAEWRASLLKTHVMPKLKNLILADITPGKIDSLLIKSASSDGTKDHIRNTPDYLPGGYEGALY